MPVPDTYSRRIGSVREETYSSYTSNRTGRPSYLSTYTSKYSSLPPRPPAYERKYSELNTTSTGGSSRFLNGTSATRSSTSSAYGGSSYSRSSVSPVRAISGSASLRRSLEGTAGTNSVSSLTDRLKTIELAAASEKDSGVTGSSSGYRYLTRNRDSSLGASTRSSPSSAYGSYSRERSGSREFGTSPLTATSIALSSRDRGDISKSDSGSRSRASSGGSNSSSSALERIRAGRGGAAANGASSRPNEVTLSSESESTSATPTATTNSVLVSNQGDAPPDRDVENNDDPDSSLSSAVGSSASSPPLLDCNNQEANPSLNMNGNDTTSTNGTDSDKRSSPPREGAANDCGRRIIKSREDASVSVVAEKGKSVVVVVDASVVPSVTPPVVFTDKDSNGNPIEPPVESRAETPKSSPLESVSASSSAKRKSVKKSVDASTKTPTISSSSSPLQTTSLKAARMLKTESDSNANVVDGDKNGSGVGSSIKSISGDLVKKPEVGVSLSLLKPKTLTTSKVQTKSKIIIHKFNVDDTSPTSESPRQLSPSPGSEVNKARKSPEKKIVTTILPAAATTVTTTASTSTSTTATASTATSTTTINGTASDSGGNVSVSVTLPQKGSMTESRQGNADPSASSATGSLTKKKASVTPSDKDENVVKLKSYGGKASGASLPDQIGSQDKGSRTGASSTSNYNNLNNNNNVTSIHVLGSRDSTPPSREESPLKSVSQQQTLSTEPSGSGNSNQSKSIASATSRSPSPATVTITLAPPRKDLNSSSSPPLTNHTTKAPTPPPLPTLSSISSNFSSTSSSPASKYSRKEGSTDDVNSDLMAGPHSSKYPATRQGKANQTPERTSNDREVPRSSARTNTYINNTSDSSDNDSDEYSGGAQIGERFRLKDSEKAGLTGLRNIGNTCFMNSVLQCLSNTRPLLEYVNNSNFMKDLNPATSGMKGELMRAFSQVIQELWRETRPVDTSAFKDQIQRFAPRFMGYSQQDAQEFLRYLLEGLHEDVNRVTAKPKPITTDIDDSLSDSQKAAESWKRYLRYEDSKIVDTFVGQLKSTLRCTTCGHCSVTFDPFWDLSLPIPSRMSSTKLSNCFELFTREEVLDGDEKPTCSKCQCRRKCTKSLSIQKFPRILVIHLKRFSPTERYRGKLSTTVEYPVKGLDLSAFSSNSSQGCSFNLYGISNHSGSTYSGHYIAYCKHPYSGEWHCYNDSRVTPLPTNSVVTSEGYVLFYEMAGQTSHL